MDMGDMLAFIIAGFFLMSVGYWRGYTHGRDKVVSFHDCVRTQEYLQNCQLELVGRSAKP